MDEWKLPEQDADIITSDRAQADLFEAAVALCNEPRKIANYMTGPMLREINQTGVELKDSALKPEALAELAKIVDGGLISAKIAQDIFSETPTASCPKPTSVKKALYFRRRRRRSDCGEPAEAEATRAARPSSSASSSGRSCAR